MKHVRMQSEELAQELRTRGYYVRQNQKGEPYYLSLGGLRSPLDSETFLGMILLDPKQNRVFGACPDTVRQFRAQTMAPDGLQGWKRLGSVVSGIAANRVPVEFHDTRIGCRTRRGIVWIDGLTEEVTCNQDGFFLDEIEQFLINLARTCVTVRKAEVPENTDC
jgi:hypothetical protein